jgi:hypothetical protein
MTNTLLKTVLLLIKQLRLRNHYIFVYFNKAFQLGGCGSVEEHLTSMYNMLGSIPRTAKEKKEKQVFNVLCLYSMK